MPISEYVGNINKRYQAGISREHSYRADLQNLLDELLDDVLVTNEPSRIECGAPDYIITKKSIPVGYIEAKDIGEPLKGKKHKEQFERYKESLPNLIITDYLDFHLYRDGEFATSIKIAEVDGDLIKPKSINFKQFKDLITDFATHSSRTITSSSKLSKMMAGKARLLSNIIAKALNEDKKSGSSFSADNSLRDQLEAFQSVLIHDIDAKEFADIYAQTIAYGMFAARLHDPTLDSFSRQEAAQLIPKTNPFLRKLFQYIAGYDLDERIDWVVDALADIFSATDVSALLKDFGKSTQQTDPIIHFYETFLAEFDPSLRKSRGVWYTPEPVVNFIVRAVDDILKDEFNLSDGLADTSKTTVKVNTDVKDKRSSTGYRQEEKEIHKVQILDPATGTGTFLAEVINQIYEKFEGQEGIWSSYVENHLIPRLNGFEILMASYAMAHLKLDMLLSETGYNRETDQRFRIYLTNSLEEYHPDIGTFWASWLSHEANEANYIKRDTPVMAVIGNPPYSKKSFNKGEWIENLMESYKETIREEESQIQSMSNDYIKFIRYGQYLINKNKNGIVGLITGHGFLNGPLARDMRKSLLRSFDKIYIINLNGSARRETNSEDTDEPVFEIQQGTAISLFIKEQNSNQGLADIYYQDLFGSREEKFMYLNDKDINSIEWEEINPEPKFYYFKPRSNTKEYDKFIPIHKIFGSGDISSDKENRWATGFATQQDQFAISFSSEEVLDKANTLINTNTFEQANEHFRLCSTNQWDYERAKKYIENNDLRDEIEDCNYRPFDYRKTIFNKNFVTILRKIKKHFESNNIALITSRVVNDANFAHVFVSKEMVDKIYLSTKSSTNAYCFPLYNQAEYFDETKLVPNLNEDFLNELEDHTGLSYSEDEKSEDHFTPENVFDYVYAILHSPTYRNRYNEFLKNNFPKIPYPHNHNTFRQLVELGGELRKIHLLEHPIVDDFITTYPVKGNNEITKRLTKTKPGFIPYTEEDEEPMTSGEDSRYPNEELGKIQINKDQYFGRVPKKAWSFPIGGYEPAEKWLKDRRDRMLSFEEIQHYQKIIVALMEADRIMQEIDKIDIEPEVFS